MSIATWCSACVRVCVCVCVCVCACVCVCVCVVFCSGHFFQGALKLDMSTLFTTFFRRTSLYFILYLLYAF